MKKKSILTILAMILVIAPAFSQDEGEEIKIGVKKEKSNAFFIGPKIGATFSTMTDPEYDLYDGMGVGFSGGVAMKMRFGKATENSYGGTGYFGVGLELKYQQNTVKTIATDESGSTNADLSVGYFAVPVYVQAYPFAKTNAVNSLYVEAGVCIAGTVSRSPETLTLTNPTSTIASATYHIDSSTSKLKGTYVRPLVGLGYTIPNTGLDVNVRYYFGVSELDDSLSSKLYTFEVSVAWMFTAFKF